MNIRYTFFLLNSFLLAPNIFAMEELSAFASEEEYIQFDAQKTKDDCHKRARALLSNIEQLKKQKVEFSLAQILPSALIDEIDRLKKTESRSTCQISQATSAHVHDQNFSLKPLQTKKEPVAEPDSPNKDALQLVEIKPTEEPTYQKSENYRKSTLIGKQLVEVSYKKKHPYQIPGWYFKFTLKKPRSRVKIEIR